MFRPPHTEPAFSNADSRVALFSDYVPGRKVVLPNADSRVALFSDYVPGRKVVLPNAETAKAVAAALELAYQAGKADMQAELRAALGIQEQE